MIVRGARWFWRQYRQRRDPVGYARAIGVRLGHDCEFFGVTAETWGSDPYLIRLGDRVYVTAGVRFVTHDGAILLFRRQYPDIDRIGPIRVGDDVFIGTNALILPGVEIGSRCIVGAGAVVHRNVPAGSVVAGVPARVVCTVDEYFQKHEQAFLHVHRMPFEEKRRFLLRHFGLGDAD
ncbi:MAG: acyltransferase [Kofleriaceae bacterium]|nr:acyltransferase [Kofleriaceae bacterium]